jgi:outer membrane lipoprotein SlyB
MLKARNIAIAALALAAGACASDPYYYSDASYSEPRIARSGPYYSSYSGGYYGNGASYNEIGRVVAIDVHRGRDGGVGAGAVVGGIVGGVLGHQIGSGSGQDLATAAGAIGGAVAGHQIEKGRTGDEFYRITVQFRDGREATFSQDSLYGIRVGDRVRVADGRVVRD